jgi:phosphoglycerate dehydrogenase-like enzyme
MGEADQRIGHQGRPVTHIVICDDTDAAFRHSDALPRLERAGAVDVYNNAAESDQAIRQRLTDAQIAILVRDRTVLDRTILSDLPRLRLIAVTPGPHRIEVQAATELGIAVAITPAPPLASIAEHVFALIFALARNVIPADRDLKERRWHPAVGMELDGKTLGILGLGRTGSAVAKRAGVFGLKVAAWGPTLTDERAHAAGATLSDADALFQNADIVSVHLRRSDWSHGFVDARRLALMKPTALLVDISWAGIVDRAALAAALRRGHLGGAGLDLCDAGPVAESDPLLDAPRTVLTPHVAWRTSESYQRFTSAVVRDVLSYVEGRPVNIVNPAALRHSRHVQE